MVSQTCYRRIDDALIHGTSLARACPRVRRDFVDRLRGPASTVAWSDAPTASGVPGQRQRRRSLRAAGPLSLSFTVRLFRRGQRQRQRPAGRELSTRKPCRHSRGFAAVSAGARSVSRSCGGKQPWIGARPHVRQSMAEDCTEAPRERSLTAPSSRHWMSPTKGVQGTGPLAGSGAEPQGVLPSVRHSVRQSVVRRAVGCPQHCCDGACHRRLTGEVAQFGELDG